MKNLNEILKEKKKKEINKIREGLKQKITAPNEKYLHFGISCFLGGLGTSYLYKALPEENEALLITNIGLVTGFTIAYLTYGLKNIMYNFKLTNEAKREYEKLTNN